MAAVDSTPRSAREIWKRVGYGAPQSMTYYLDQLIALGRVTRTRRQLAGPNFQWEYRATT